MKTTQGEAAGNWVDGLLAVFLLDELGEEREDLVETRVNGGLELFKARIVRRLELFKARVHRSDVGFQLGNILLEIGNILFNVLRPFIDGFIDDSKRDFFCEGLDSVGRGVSVT